MGRGSEVVAACFAAFGARDVDGFLRLVHEDVTWQPSSTLLAFGGTGGNGYLGHEGIRAWFRDMAAWDGYSVRTLGAHESGDRVLVPAVATLVHDATWLSRAVAFVFTLRDGRVSELRTFAREDEARRYAGVAAAVAEIAPDASDTGSLRMPADPAEVSGVRERLRAVAEGAEMDPPAVNDLLVAVTEALTNAITHGRPDEQGTIRVRWGREEDVLAVCVEDRGTFDGRDAETREDHGRGLAVMRLLLDDLAIEARADRTLVRLAKSVRPS